MDMEILPPESNNNTPSQVTRLAMRAMQKKPGLLDRVKNDLLSGLRARFVMMAALVDATTAECVRAAQMDINLTSQHVDECHTKNAAALESVQRLFDVVHAATEEGRMPADSPVMANAFQILEKFNTGSTKKLQDHMRRITDSENPSDIGDLSRSASAALLNTCKMDDAINSLYEYCDANGRIPNDVKYAAYQAKMSSTQAVLSTTLATRKVMMDTPIVGTLLHLNGAAIDFEKFVGDNAEKAREFISDTKDAIVDKKDRLVAGIAAFRDKAKSKIDGILEFASVFSRNAAKEAVDHIQHTTYSHEVNRDLNGLERAQAKLNESYEKMSKQMEQLSNHVDACTELVNISSGNGELAHIFKEDQLRKMRSPEGVARANDKLDKAVSDVDKLQVKMNEVTQKMEDLKAAEAHLPMHRSLLNATKVSVMDRIKSAWDKTVEQINSAKQASIGMGPDSVKALEGPSAKRPGM